MKKYRLFHLELTLHNRFQAHFENVWLAAELIAISELTKTVFSSKEQTHLKVGSRTLPAVDGVITQQRLVNSALPLNGSSQCVVASLSSPIVSPKYLYFLFRSGRFITKF
jgi:hypothetical protein